MRKTKKYTIRKNSILYFTIEAFKVAIASSIIALICYMFMIGIQEERQEHNQQILEYKKMYIK